jgi:type I restriction enzyme S subunit
MQQLLTKGIGHIKFKQTEVGEIPEEWLIIPFGEICQNTQLGTAKRGLEGEKKVALIKMGNLTFGGLDLSDLEMVGYDGSELDQYKLERGDFLFNTRNTPDLVGKTAVWNGGTQEAVFDNNIMRIYFKSEYVASSHMINYFLSSDLGRRWLRMRVHQTTSVAAIYWKQLRKIPIPIPPFDEQKRIINILLLHDAKIENETQKKAQLMKLKKGLMQDLLTGKVRVKVD